LTSVRCQRSSSTQTETCHGAAAGKAEDAPSKPRQDEERETRKAIVEDADKTEGKDRALVHGDGGTLGLERPEDLSHDD
jgi:hypothetical protein